MSIGARLRLSFRKLAQQFVALLGQDRFGVELHALDGQRLVAHAHDLVDAAVVVLGPGGDFQAVGQALALDHQRVVAGRGRTDWAGPANTPWSVVEHRAGLAVHGRPRAHDLAAEGLADALVAEADAENRQLAGELRGSPPARCRPRWACRGRAR